MLRYHKEVFTEPKHWETLKALTDYFNGMKWSYSGHCLDNIKSRAVDMGQLLRFIKGLRLEAGDIFEYYLDEKTSEPVKVCYRISYIPGLDIILVIGEDKKIITIYMNSREDKHETLKRELYIRG